jgi:uncharacterized protein (TIGR02246 family)
MSSDLEDFGSDYAAAWSSHDPERVASFFAPSGSLSVNDGEPAVGRAALADLAQGFFTDLPDLVVVMNAIEEAGGRIIFQWTLTATSAAGKPLNISGQESWRLDEFGQIAESLGSFDAADYARQLGG